MFQAATDAITQMFSPPLRAVLWKSIGLALALIIIVSIALDRAIVWLVGAGSTWGQTALGPHANWPVEALARAASDRGLQFLLSYGAGRTSCPNSRLPTLIATPQGAQSTFPHALSGADREWADQLLERGDGREGCEFAGFRIFGRHIFNLH